MPETMRIINDIGYPLYNGFGMTEAGITSVELSHNIDDRLEASVGKAFCQRGIPRAAKRRRFQCG